MPIAIADMMPIAIPAMAPVESLWPGEAGNEDAEDVGAEDMDVENVDIEDMIAEDIIAEEEGIEKADDTSCGEVVFRVPVPVGPGSTTLVKYGCTDMTVSDDDTSESYCIGPYGTGEGNAMLVTLGFTRGELYEGQGGRYRSHNRGLLPSSMEESSYIWPSKTSGRSIQYC